MGPRARPTTLEGMSPHPTLLIRRWPERRPVVLTAAALGFAAVLVAGGPAEPELGALYVLPVMLAALELGVRRGLAAAAGAAAVSLVAGAAAPAIAVLAVGAIAGRFSDRMRAVLAREQRLVESGLALGAHERLPEIVAAALLGMPRVIGVEVTLDGAPALVTGRMAGARSETDIVAGERTLGRLVVAHRGRLEREDRAALELLAVQVGLAADNQRLLVQERDAAALEARLRRVRDDLVEQRSGLGRLLAAQEDDRDRFADTLHEELAQVLAAILLGLRMLRRHGSLDEATLDGLHDQALSALTGVRELAGALRPTSLAHLGLVPALEALRDSHHHLAVDANGIPEPLPEPLRTGLYRLIESVLGSATPGARAHVELRGTDGRLDLVIDVALHDPTALLSAARARAALLEGSLVVDSLPDERIRIRAGFPVGRGEILSAPAG